jgi:hypothetical protein
MKQKTITNEISVSDSEAHSNGNVIAPMALCTPLEWQRTSG